MFKFLLALVSKIRIFKRGRIWINATFIQVAHYSRKTFCVSATDAHSGIIAKVSHDTVLPMPGRYTIFQKPSSSWRLLTIADGFKQIRAILHFAYHPNPQMWIWKGAFQPSYPLAIDYSNSNKMIRYSFEATSLLHLVCPHHHRLTFSPCRLANHVYSRLDVYRVTSRFWPHGKHQKEFYLVHAAVLKAL